MIFSLRAAIARSLVCSLASLSTFAPTFNGFALLFKLCRQYVIHFFISLLICLSIPSPNSFLLLQILPSLFIHKINIFSELISVSALYDCLLYILTIKRAAQPLHLPINAVSSPPSPRSPCPHAGRALRGDVR